MLEEINLPIIRSRVVLVQNRLNAEIIWFDFYLILLEIICILSD